MIKKIVINFINKDIFFAMRGILGQYVIVIPEKNTIIVRLGERNNEKDNNRPKDFDVYFNGWFYWSIYNQKY